MLKELAIRNYALIDELMVAFGPGLNVITGETGAGKSIIVGALMFLLGDRGQKEVIRQGAQSAIVEGVFEVPDPGWLESYRSYFELDGNRLLLRREVHESGRTRCFVNDTPVPLSTLSEIGDRLVDFHGQHDHQALLNAQNHLRYLDRFGVPDGVKESFLIAFRRFHSLESELETLLHEEEALSEKRDLLRFRIDEIGRLNPSVEEEETLEREERILKHSERIHTAYQRIMEILSEDEGSAIARLDEAFQLLSGMGEIDIPFSEWAELCRSAQIAVEEVIRSLQSYVTDIEFDPDRLNAIRERLGAYNLLKKKYGGTTEEMIRLYEETKAEYDRIGTLAHQIDEKKRELEEVRDALKRSVIELSDARRECKTVLSETIVRVLSDLGLEKAVFHVQQEWIEDPEGAVQIDGKRVRVGEQGAERIAFLISTNPGEEPRPLQRVASGGEISRVMLALKSALAHADEIPVLIFDEIDTGISGRIARIVGHNLRRLAENHQIICITHLPQIASLGQIHFSVKKVLDQGRTITTMRRLSDEERVYEIARLLGGDSLTESVIQSAKELLGVDSAHATLG